MRHFVIFITLIFLGLAAVIFQRTGESVKGKFKSELRVYAPSSFVAKWGAGPALKEDFEKQCECNLVWLDSGDISLLLQRIRLDSAQVGADLIMGLDQYSLDLASRRFEWKKLLTSPKNVEPGVKAYMEKFHFLAYDWGVLSLILRKSENPIVPTKLNDLLTNDFNGKIALMDPRTSTPGQVFLYWLIQSRGEEEAFKLLKEIEPVVMTYAPSWSTAYGLFSKTQAAAVFSYVTSPIYHQIEEKNMDVVAAILDDKHPIQVEYLGIPQNCQHCDLAERFVRYLLSKDAQRIIMEKNYMFPVLGGVMQGTPFDLVDKYPSLTDQVMPSIQDRERILKRWSDLRE